MFLKKITHFCLIATSVALCYLFINPSFVLADDVDFRHMGITKPKKTAKYGFMNLGYVTSFTANNIYGLGLDRNSQLFQAVESYLKSNNSGVLTNSLDLSSQNMSINLGFGYKTNSMFRFDTSFSFIQGRAIIIPQTFTATLNTINASNGQTISTSYSFSNVDIQVRNISAMLNAYIDSDFSVFRTYIGFGLGPSILNASIRGNQNFGNGLSTDYIRTKQRYNNFSIIGNFALGSHILISKQIALDISYRNFFNIASLSRSQQYTKADGSSASTSSPSSFTIQVITLGVVMYF